MLLCIGIMKYIHNKRKKLFCIIIVRTAIEINKDLALPLRYNYCTGYWKPSNSLQVDVNSVSQWNFY